MKLTKFTPKFTKYITKKELDEYNNTDSISIKNAITSKIVEVLGSGFDSIMASDEFTWYFDGAQEGEIGGLPDQLNLEDHFDIVIESIKNRDYGRYISPNVKVKDIVKEDISIENIKLIELKEMLSNTLKDIKKKKSKPKGLGLAYCIKQIDKLLK